MNKSLYLGLLTVPLLLSVGGCFSRIFEGPTIQGWTEEERISWYQGTQGSRLIPKAWFDALEQTSSDAPLADNEYLRSFGFITLDDKENFPLPVGFTVDRQDDSDLSVTGLRWYDKQPSKNGKSEPWIGLNCSACHTAQIVYQGETMTIDGGPNLLDFQLFVETLDQSLHATKNDSGKWERFSKNVLKGKDTVKNRAMLESAFDRLLGWQDLTADMNGTGIRYGYGRLDAVGHILNKILMFTGSSKESGNASNAPVSYPFLWQMWKQEKVQWNGVAENSRLKTPGDPIEYGALGRNTGEVLGVFGEVTVHQNEGIVDTIKGYNSSVDTRNLMRMEQILQSLETPAWPDIFPPIDADRQTRGKALFERDCIGCHLTSEMQVEGEPTERMVLFSEAAGEDLTDIWMACNAYIYDGPTGLLEGSKDNSGQVMTGTAPVATMLAATVKGALIGDASNLIKESILNFAAIRRLPEVTMAMDPFDPRGADRAICTTTPGVNILAYKARPLDGIWATAPYLHNGSVNSLYELLLPAALRSETFWVGTREYDPVTVGYESKEMSSPQGFMINTRIEGNRNIGHEYGVGALTDEDRWALLEYLKTL